MAARIRIALVAGCLIAALTAATRADAFELRTVGTSFDRPIYMTSPPADPRLFVVERPGKIEVIHDGVTSQFLDIHQQTTTDFERGLLSMAFDPHYATNGLFYVFYTSDGSDSDGALGDGHVDEFHVSSDPNVADPTSQRRVLTITRPGTGGCHNGGQLQFGRDGYLYISVGDGCTGGSTARDLTFLNGKILRIDPHGASPGDYAIPSDNPYTSSGTARHEIWDSGFRNPWRFSFDRLTGDLVIADVGEVTWEEVDFAPASTGLGRGVDWGWNACEGFYAKGSTSTLCSTPGVAAPAFAYPHTDPGGDAATGCAVMGGYVYRGNQIPELSGRYLYTDNCHGELRSLQLGNPASGDRAESAAGALNGPDSFGEDASCNLYVTTGPGTVDEIVPSNPPAVAPACQVPPATPVARKKKCKRHKKHAASAKKHKKKHKKKHCKRHKKKK